MEAVVVIISVLVASSIVLGIFSFSESRGANTKHARRTATSCQELPSDTVNQAQANNVNQTQMTLDDHSQKAA